MIGKNWQILGDEFYRYPGDDLKILVLADTSFFTYFFRTKKGIQSFCRFLQEMTRRRLFLCVLSFKKCNIKSILKNNFKPEPIDYTTAYQIYFSFISGLYQSDIFHFGYAYLSDLLYLFNIYQNNYDFIYFTFSYYNNPSKNT